MRPCLLVYVLNTLFSLIVYNDPRFVHSMSVTNKSLHTCTPTYIYIYIIHLCTHVPYVCCRVLAMIKVHVIERRVLVKCRFWGIQIIRTSGTTTTTSPPSPCSSRSSPKLTRNMQNVQTDSRKSLYPPNIEPARGCPGRPLPLSGSMLIGMVFSAGKNAFPLLRKYGFHPFLQAERDLYVVAARNAAKFVAASHPGCLECFCTTRCYVKAFRGSCTLA